MKKEIKEDLKKLSVKDLMSRLRELQAERMKLETKMYRMGGSKRSYPLEGDPQKGGFGNVRRVKKDIARVKTFLTIKMKQNAA